MVGNQSKQYNEEFFLLENGGKTFSTCEVSSSFSRENWQITSRRVRQELRLGEPAWSGAIIFFGHLYRVIMHWVPSFITLPSFRTTTHRFHRLCLVYEFLFVGLISFKDNTPYILYIYIMISLSNLHR